MRDWRVYVRSQLPPLACSADREREIVDEIAEQLQDIHDAAVRRAPRRDADAQARAEVSDWSALGRDLLAAEHPISAPPRRFVSTVVAPAARRSRLAFLSNTGPRATRDPYPQDPTALHRHHRRDIRARHRGHDARLCVGGHGADGAASVSPAGSTRVRPASRARIAERYPILGVNPRSFLAYQASCCTTCDALAAIASHTATLTGASDRRAWLARWCPRTSSKSSHRTRARPLL